MGRNLLVRGSHVLQVLEFGSVQEICILLVRYRVYYFLQLLLMGIITFIKRSQASPAHLSNFFRQRDCVTLVRPAEEESQLKNLNEQPYESLRPEFRKVFESMKKKLLKNIQPKMLYGNVLNGAMLANLAQTYS